VSGIHFASGSKGLENRLDKTVAGVAGQPLAVGAEIGQLACAVPNAHCRAGGYSVGAGQGVDDFHVAQVVGQLAVAAGFLQGIELHSLGRVLLDQLAQVLLVTNIARAGRVPEVHQANRARATEGGRQLQRIAGEHRRVLAEGAQVAALEPVICGPQHAGADNQDQTGEQGITVGRSHSEVSSQVA